MKTATVSTHVLDTGRGAPAEGVTVTLAPVGGGDAQAGRTGSDGRHRFEREVPAGSYRLSFEVAGRRPGFFQSVELVVLLEDGHYHVPLLLAPFGVTTYRGS